MSVMYKAVLFRGYKIIATDISDELLMEELIDEKLLHFVRDTRDGAEFIFGDKIAEEEENVEPLINLMVGPKRDSELQSMVERYFPSEDFEWGNPITYFGMSIY